ncbi:MAG TPA: glycosyltransferase family 39 protein, partial [Candidatus Binataceae bacterium]
IHSIPGEPVMTSYYTFLHLWMALGTSEVMLRVPSLVFSAATVPMIYFLGRRLISSRVGIVAAVLFAFHASAIRYAQEARSYSLTGLLIVISCLYFLRAIERDRAGDWLGYLVVSVFAVYAHFFTIFVLTAQWLFLLVVRPRTLLSKRVILIAISVAVLSAPVAMLISLASHLRHHWRYIPANSLSNTSHVVFILSGWSAGVTGLAAQALTAAYFAAIVAALIACGKAWRRSREQAEGYLFLAICTFLPVGLVFAGSLIQPIVVIRYFILFLPLLVILVAAGVCQIRPVRILTMVTVIVLMFEGWGTIAYYRHFHKANVRAAVQFVVSNMQSGDALTPDYRIHRQFEYYYGRANKQAGVDLQSLANLRLLPMDAAALEARQRSYERDCCRDPRHWVIELRLENPDALKIAPDWTMLRQALDRGYREVQRRKFGRAIVVLLFTSPHSAQEPSPAN